MRAAYHNVYFHFEEGGIVTGISAGWDFCAEHERGIRPLADLLGIPNTEFPMGVADRTVNLSKEARNSIRFETFTCRMPTAPGNTVKSFKLLGARLLITPNLQEDWFKKSDAVQKSPKRPQMASLFGTARHEDLNVDGYARLKDSPRTTDYLIESRWSDSGLELVVWGMTRVKALMDIYQALNADAATVSIGARSNPFGSGGLHIMIPERLSETVCREILDADLAYKNRVETERLIDSLNREDLITVLDNLFGVGGIYTQPDDELRRKLKIAKSKGILPDALLADYREKATTA